MKNLRKSLYLVGIVTLVAALFNLTRFSWRTFLFPLLLLLIPFHDKSFLPNFHVEKSTLKLLGLIILSIAVFFPPSFFFYFSVLFHYRAHLPSLSSLSEAFLKSAILTVTVALPEEVFFRGYVQETLLKDYRKRLLPLVSQKNLITSFLFGFSHALSYMDILRFSTFFPSLLFGYLTERGKGSVAYSILLHGFSNMIAMILFQFLR